MDFAESPHTRWKVKPYPWVASNRLAGALGLPLVSAMVLAGRGITDPVEARRFLECEADIPDPFLFSHMGGAVAAISAAIQRGGRVVVHGDYDADGITATALMIVGLRDLGLEVEWYLPSRFKEGYGLSRTAVETITAGGPGVLITVDCGVNYPDEVEYAKESGFEVVVVDHHQPGPVLPDCHLIHEVAGAYPHGTLCGVGLALKVLHALHMTLRGAAADRLPKDLESMLDLVAVGTIADLASLIGENRYYVREGLKLIAIGRRTGLRALAAVSGCTGAADSAVVAYRLAPRLNAAGRLADPSPPLRLLLTEDDKEAAELAQTLHELNGARQDVERQILDEAVRCVESQGPLPPVIVLTGEGWHEGVVGIVAARLVERYHRPAILLGQREGVAKGSGRSIARYDIMEALNACAEHLTIYGGHPQAVGLTLGADRVDHFRRAIEQHAGALLSPTDLVPAYLADAVLRGEDIDADTGVALSSLGPFGSGNPQPRLLVVGADIQQPEPTRDGSHMRCSVRVDGVRARGIAFGMGASAEALKADGCSKVLGVQLKVDSWQGSLRPEFLIERLASPEAGAGLPECGPGCPLWNAERGADPSGSEAMPVMRPPAGWEVRAGLDPRLVSRDLRDRSGLTSALAQVLATGETTLVVGCSVPHMLTEAREKLPFADLCRHGLVCLAACCQGSKERADDAEVVISEWDVVARAPELGARVHIVAVDPPYRTEHVASLREAGEKGANLHLYYGHGEREAAARLLRYLVHPRFAMVCVYRALRELDSSRKDVVEAEVLRRAAELAWQEAHVHVGHDRFVRALEILRSLGLDRASSGEAKLDARDSSAYAEMEAEYEECARLCLSL